MADFPECSIDLEDTPMDCDLHPTQPLICTGLVSGHLELHSYETTKTSVQSSSVWATLAFKKDSSCRCAKFSADGSSIITGSTGGSIRVFNTETGKRIQNLKGAHEESLSAIHVIDNTTLATGDESGCIKVWDSRTNTMVYQYTKHTDFISGFAMHTSDGCLCATSGDGTLSIHDLKKRKLRARSEADADDELLALAVVKNGKKVVCGSQSGVINLYSWGYFNDCSDRFPGHPESVDALVKYDEDTVITGSSDGMLRILNVLPNKLLGIIGAHDEFPIEHLAVSHDMRVLASLSHSSTVKLWNVSSLMDTESEAGVSQGGDSDEEEAGGEEAGVDSDEQGGEVSDEDVAQEGEESEDDEKPKAASECGGSEEGSERDDDSDDDSDDGGKHKHKRAKREKTKWTKSKANTQKNNFFADLL